MLGKPPYRRTALTLIVAAWLAQACADADSLSESQSDTSSIAEPTASGDQNSDHAADDDSSEEAEAPLDPGRSYPTSAAKPPSVMRDAGAASSAAAPNAGQPPPARPAPDVSVPAAQPTNPFVEASKDPFSTFGADVDTASYDYLRQSLQRDVLPAPAYVRVEEYVNYFAYDYPKPALDAASPFAIALAASAHPMGRPTTLVRVGIQAKAPPASEKKPANIVYLVDVSGSMASPEKLPLVKRVLEQSLNVLAPSDKVSIVTYASDTRVRVAPTLVSDRAPITAEIAALEASGGTNGGSGIQLAYQQAAAGFIPGGINHVILCTDGDFNVGITSNDALLALIREQRATGVTLTALGFGRDNLNDDMMEKVSNAGNGSYSIVYNEDQAIEYANKRLLSTIVHVAKDMKIQVEFNPALVLAYRLVGYEDRAIADGSFRDDKVDGGEVGADHRVTALYELVLAGGQVPTAAGIPPLSAGEASQLVREIDPSELVRVKVRSKPVTATDADPATEVTASLRPSDMAASADQDLAWASAVATLAEILRASPYANKSELAVVERIANEQRARDSARGEFANLLAQVRMLIPALP